MFSALRGDSRHRRCGVAGEDENILNLVKPADIYLLCGYCQNLFLGEIPTVNSLFPHLMIEVRVGKRYSLSLCFHKHHAEELKELIYRFLLALGFSGEESLEVTEKLRLQFTKRDIVDIVLLHELYNATLATLILLVGLVATVDANHLLCLCEEFIIYRHERFLLSSDTHIGILHHFCGDIAMSIEQILIMVLNDIFDVIEAFVERHYSC